MPPWLDSAEEVAAVATAVVVAVGAIVAAFITASAGVYAVWRSKVKPLLTRTEVAASHAAEQLTPNHGSTVRDAVRRTEAAVGRLDLNTNQRIGDLHALMGRHIDQNDRAHSEIFKRLHQIESPPEETRS